VRIRNRRDIIFPYHPLLLLRQAPARLQQGSGHGRSYYTRQRVYRKISVIYHCLSAVVRLLWSQWSLSSTGAAPYSNHKDNNPHPNLQIYPGFQTPSPHYRCNNIFNLNRRLRMPENRLSTQPLRIKSNGIQQPFP